MQCRLNYVIKTTFKYIYIYIYIKAMIITHIVRTQKGLRMCLNTVYFAEN